MKRKVGVVVFFIIVFGLPVGWYLFLQLFGENKFDLPVIGAWPEECLLNEERGKGILAYRESLAETSPNEFKRVRNQLTSQESASYLEFVKTGAPCLENFGMILVDETGRIRGTYQATREDVDRLLAEVDIYLMNRKDGAGNKSK